MKIKEIMTEDVEVIHPTDTLKTAAQKMRDRNIGFLPVVEGDELLGVLTDRDLVVRAMAEGQKLNMTIGRDFATSPGVYIFEDEEVGQAADLMRQHRIRRLVVLGRDDGNITGIVSLGDLAIDGVPDMAGGVLRVVSSELVKTH